MGHYYVRNLKWYEVWGIKLGEWGKKLGKFARKWGDLVLAVVMVMAVLVLEND